MMSVKRVVFVLCAIALNAYADVWKDVRTGLEWTYEVSDDGAKLVVGENGCCVNPKPNGSLVIPNFIDELPLTAIGCLAFYECSSLTEVAIPPNVREIEGRAFWVECEDYGNKIVVYGGCKSLKSVRFADGSNLKIIGFSAFSGCPIENIALPPGLESIGDSAFEYCAQLRTVALPDSIARIDAYAFDACKLLCEAVLPKALTEISNHAFCRCSSLSKLVVSGQVTKIGFYAFAECTSLADVMLTDGITEIGSLAFSGCCALRQIVLPAALQTVSAGAFSHCSLLENIRLPRHVQSLGNSAFSDCIGLSSVVLHSELAEVGWGVFNRCGNLHWIYVDRGDAERLKSMMDETLPVQSVFVEVVPQVEEPEVSPAETAFDTASQEVTISCATEGATVYVTIDGSEPSAANGRVYRGPFSIYDSVTVKAIAVKDDWKDSAVASASFTKNNGLSAAINMYDYLPDNDLSAPWTVDKEVSHDGVKSARSGVIGEDGVTTMKVTVRGAGRLSFWWKSECEEWDEDYYDYGAFCVGSETEPRLRIAGMTDWKREEIVFDTTGKHVCKWEYHKDDAETIPRDCIWVDQVQWLPYGESEHDHTLTTEVPVPYLWLDSYGLGRETELRDCGQDEVRQG